MSLQAAISHQIKALEDHLGLKLFMRKNRSLLLTEEGQSYFLDIKEIFLQLHEATEKLWRGAKGSLTVSVAAEFCHSVAGAAGSIYSVNCTRISTCGSGPFDLEEGSLTDDVDVCHLLWSWQLA